MRKILQSKQGNLILKTETINAIK